MRKTLCRSDRAEDQHHGPPPHGKHGCHMDIKSLLIVILLVSTLILACEVLPKSTYITSLACSKDFIAAASLKITRNGDYVGDYIPLATANKPTQDTIPTTTDASATIINASEWDIHGLQPAIMDEHDDHLIKQAMANIDNNTQDHNGDSFSKPIIVNNANVTMREFKAFGSAASVFVQFGAYRGGDNSFAIVGLGSKPLHVYGNASFMCEWEPAGHGRRRRVKGKADKILPDWGYGRVYTVVVVNCTFQQGVGVDGHGGKLILHATSAETDMATFVALEETSESYAITSTLYKEENYKYDFLYCGSSLFGNINPQRMREWLAYHVKLMGPKSHFVFHDAGGVSPLVRQVLSAWQALGYITLHDIREQSKFDGYYYNQFLVVNDCLHRTRFLAKWTFFFDVDEYLYVPPQTTLFQTMESFSNYSQITFEQSPMSSNLCLSTHKSSNGRRWGFEKLIFRNIKRGYRWDRKYAIQARNVFATGVHISENVVGKTLHTRGPSIKYYHYHNTITTKEADLCKEFLNSSSTRHVTFLDKDPFRIDLGLQYFAQGVKGFELQNIGPQPFLA